MIVRALVFAWCFARPLPLACDMTFPPTPICDNAQASWGVTLGENLSDAAIQAETDYQVLLEWARKVVHEFKLWPHTERILRAISPAVSLAPLRTWLCVPPRHGKTECALILASYLICHYSMTVGYVAYGDALANDASERCQDMVMRAERGFQRGRARKDSWSVVGGGHWFSGGISTGWNGKGLDFAIPDDLIKGDEQSRSGDERDKVWRKFQRDVLSRKNRAADFGVVGIGTRWHADDPGGRVISGQLHEDYNVVVMPALNLDGTALCPDIMPVRELERIRKSDTAGYWSLYMQDPRPDGVSIFSLRPAPTFDRADWKRTFHRLAIFCDPAATAKTSSDRSAFGVLAASGFGDEMTVEVLEAVHGRFTPEQLAPELVAMWKRWGKRLDIHVEAIGTGAFLPSLIKAVAVDASRFVKPIASTPLVKVTSDKYARALPVARAFNEGRVRFADEAWTAGALEELYAFTGLDDPHDDFVDMLAHGWNTLYRASAAAPRLARSVSNLIYG